MCAIKSSKIKAPNKNHKIPDFKTVSKIELLLFLVEIKICKPESKIG
jgi:hypothetical protein